MERLRTTYSGLRHSKWIVIGLLSLSCSVWQCQYRRPLCACYHTTQVYSILYIWKETFHNNISQNVTEMNYSSQNVADGYYFAESSHDKRRAAHKPFTVHFVLKQAICTGLDTNPQFVLTGLPLWMRILPRSLLKRCLFLLFRHARGFAYIKRDSTWVSVPFKWWSLCNTTFYLVRTTEGFRLHLSTLWSSGQQP